MEKVRYMISDAATMAGVESHVLRYWEDELELAIPRNEMGHRYYTRENIQEFQKIKELKEQGYQLKAIRMILHNGGAIPQGMLADGSQAPAGTIPPSTERPKNSPAISIVPHPSAEAAAAAAAGNEPPKFTVSQQALTSSAATVPISGFTAGAQPAGPVGMPGAEFVVATQQPAMAAAMQGAQPAPLSAEERMAQFRELMSDIVGHAIEQNNEELSLNISQEVKETVLKEMNYLFREQDEAQEERYKKLDAAIRGNLQKKRSFFAAKDKPPKEKKEKAAQAGQESRRQKGSFHSMTAWHIKTKQKDIASKKKLSVNIGF